VKLLRTSGANRLEWDGEGEVFQLERAASPAGPWLPCSPIAPDLSFDDADGAPAAEAGFYRLRQW
jgi:hypothetical protein